MLSIQGRLAGSGFCGACERARGTFFERSVTPTALLLPAAATAGRAHLLIASQHALRLIRLPSPADERLSIGVVYTR